MAEAIPSISMVPILSSAYCVLFSPYEVGASPTLLYIGGNGGPERLNDLPGTHSWEIEEPDLELPHPTCMCLISAVLGMDSSLPLAEEGVGVAVDMAFCPLTLSSGAASTEPHRPWRNMWDSDSFFRPPFLPHRLSIMTWTR